MHTYSRFYPDEQILAAATEVEVYLKANGNWSYRRPLALALTARETNGVKLFPALVSAAIDEYLAQQEVVQVIYNGGDNQVVWIGE